MKKPEPRRVLGLFMAAMLGAAQACPESPEAVLFAVNALRAQGGPCGARGAYAAAAAVSWNPTLEAMARRHALFLVSVGELRHRNDAGQALAERAQAAGYRYGHIGENLAQGQATLGSVLQAWTHSPTHCATLFGAGFSEAGLACERAADGRPLWVMVLARPRP
jgi:uncharacterized protein YkwD